MSAILQVNLATPSCTDVSSQSGIMRPYIPNSKVGDIGSELPHYYCNAHNPDPDSYPVEPGKDVTIVKEPVAPPPKDDDEEGGSGGDSGEDGGGDSGGNSGGSTEGGGNTGGSGSATKPKN